MTAISADSLRKSFGKKEVLRGVSFDVRQGEVFGLLGPSGAGKTTLIKILTGQLAPTDGASAIGEIPSGRLSMADRRKIGIMMDEFGLYERLSCFENLKVFADLYGVGAAQIRAVLADFGLAEAERRAADKLSRGMKSRLRLARAFLTEPEVMFLDEPTTGLDPATAAEIHRMILKKKAAGRTVFLTTHNMAEAQKLCDRVILLYEGNIVESGTPEEICLRYNHLRRLLIRQKDGKELSLPSSPASAETVRALLAADSLETIHSSEPDLEKVFMELTGAKLDI